MKLLIVDDHPMVRKGLQSMLKDNNIINEIEEAANQNEAELMIGKEKPDIALIDLKLGRESGIDLVSKGKQLCNKTKFLLLTSFISREDFLKAEEVGFDGYILKDAYVEDIIYAISLVLRGKKYYDPNIVDYKDKGSCDKGIEQLTDREKEVLRELGRGLCNEEIAQRLYISQNTVKKHISSILTKLNFNNRSQAIFYVNDKLSM